MSIGFGLAFFQAGGKAAVKGLRDAAMTAAPNISIAAGQIVAESRLDDDAGEVLKRTRTRLNEVQAAFDLVAGPYQQKVAAADGIQQKMAGFQATIDDPNASDADKGNARTQLAAHEKSLAGLLDKIEKSAPDFDKKKKDLEETQAFLRQAEDAFKQRAQRTVAGVAEAKELRQKIDQANLEREQAKQQAADARVVAGLATDDEGENPAVTAMKRALEKANADTEQYKFKAETLTAVAHHDDDDDPIVKAAIAEASGSVPTSSMSVADRLAALRRPAA